MMDNRLEAVALGLTEIARVYEGGKRIDTKELCAGLRNYAAMVRAVAVKGPEAAAVNAVADAVRAVAGLPVSCAPWHEAALKSLTETLVGMLAPPNILEGPSDAQHYLQQAGDQPVGNAKEGF